MKLNRRGMTLIEIMIVMIILGGLLAIIGNQVFSRFGKAKVQQAKIQMSEIGKALLIFNTDCQHFPTSEQGLNALLEAPSDCQSWGPEAYLKKNQLKDPWGSDFIYEMDGSKFTLKSYGADRREGGTGNNADLSSEDI